MSNINSGYAAILKQTGDWWIGWIEEIPGTNCQERTREALLESIAVMLQDATSDEEPAS